MPCTQPIDLRVDDASYDYRPSRVSHSGVAMADGGRCMPIVGSIPPRRVASAKISANLTESRQSASVVLEMSSIDAE